MCMAVPLPQPISLYLSIGLSIGLLHVDGGRGAKPLLVIFHRPYRIKRFLWDGKKKR